MKRKILLLLLSTIVVYLSILFYIKYEVQNRLEQNPKISFKELNIDYKAEIQIIDVIYESTKFKISKLKVNLNLAYLKLITGDQIVIDNLNLSHATLEYFEAKKDTLAKKERTSTDFLIHNLELKNINLSIESAGKNLKIKSLDALLTEISQSVQFNLNTIKNLSFSDLAYPINDLHEIKLSKFSLKKNRAYLDQFRLVPLYNKDNYTNQVKIETDLINLNIPSIEFDLSEFVYKNKKIQRIHFNKIVLDSALLEIYRDKSLPNDTSIKPSYSKRLKDLEVEFGINQLIANHSRVLYGERYGSNKDYAIVDFNNIDLSLDSLNNYLEKNYTKLKSKFKLNDESDLEFFMTYDLHSEFESFNAILESENVKAFAFSELLRQGMSKGIEGKINSLSADFKARNNMASGSFDLKASDIKLKIYNKNHEENKILSFLANQIVKKEIDKSLEIKEVEKDQTKSFWNYIWTFIKTGLKRSLL